MKVSTPKTKVKVIIVRIAAKGDSTTVTVRGSEDRNEVLDALDKATVLLSNVEVEQGGD